MKKPITTRASFKMWHSGCSRILWCGLFLAFSKPLGRGFENCNNKNNNSTFYRGDLVLWNDPLSSGENPLHSLEDTGKELILYVKIQISNTYAYV